MSHTTRPVDYDLFTSLNFTPWLEYFAGGILDELFRLEDALNQAATTPEQPLQPHYQAILAHTDEHGCITDRDAAVYCRGDRDDGAEGVGLKG